MLLRLNDEEHQVTSVDTLRTRWTHVHGRQFSELWLEAGDTGPFLGALVNGDAALLIYLRNNEGDPGFSSRNPHFSGSEDELIEFVLDNGQQDEHPAAWVVPLDEAQRACEYFLQSGGERAPEIVWHDDASEDEGRC